MMHSYIAPISRLPIFREFPKILGEMLWIAWFIIVRHHSIKLNTSKGFIGFHCATIKTGTAIGYS